MSKERESDSQIGWKEYKERENIELVIGVIGGMKIENETYNEALLTEGLAEASSKLGRMAVLSGGTEGGVPEMSVRVAEKLGLYSVGVYPADAEKYALGERLSYKLAVQTPANCEIKWGVETPVLTSLGDVYVMFGGEWGSLTEIGMLMKRNKSLISRDQSPTPIILINNSGPVIRHILDMASDFGHLENGLLTIDNGLELGYTLSAMFSK